MIGFWRHPPAETKSPAPAPEPPTDPLVLRAAQAQREAETANRLLREAYARIAALHERLAAAQSTSETVEIRRLRREAEQARRNCALLEERLAELEGRQFDAGRSEQGRVLFAGLRAMSPLVGPAPIQDKALKEIG